MVVEHMCRVSQAAMGANLSIDTYYKRSLENGSVSISRCNAFTFSRSVYTSFSTFVSIHALIRTGDTHGLHQQSHDT
jgi:hypothetical protein